MNKLLQFILLRLLEKNKQSFSNLPQLVIFSQDHIGNAINAYGRYEGDILEALKINVFPLLRNRRNCLDIGANIGNHSVYFSDHFNSVISFEPHKKVFDVLSINASLKNNIFPFNIGLSDEAKTVFAKEEISNMGGTTIIGENQGDFKNSRIVSFELNTLDNFIAENNIKDIDFMKIDIEGHELLALKGGNILLNSDSPVIAFECSIDEVDNGTSDVFSLLQYNGYEYMYELRFQMPKIFMFTEGFTNLYKFFLSVFNKEKEFRLQKITSLEKKFYHLVIASKYELIS
jgi:FkbM family methyltransferase